MSVVEAAIISTVGVYGMWIVATKGRRSHERVIRRGPDGNWEESEKTEWYGPSGTLEAIRDMLGRPGGGADKLPPDGRPPLPPAEPG